MIRKFIAAFALIFFMASTTAFANASIDWERGIIRATGMGIGPVAWDKKDSFYRTYARQAAQLDALRNIAELFQGFHVTPTSTVRDLALENDVLETALTADVNPLRPMKISNKFFSDGTCEVVMEVKLFGKGGSVAEVVFASKNESKIPFAKPINSATLNNAKYTGLIVDCSGLSLLPAMLPAIKAPNGQAIYSHENIDNEKIITNGIVIYADKASEQLTLARVGNNPLVVKAVSLTDLNANPVVSATDADKILAANQRDKFLDNCAVVFVK